MSDNEKKSEPAAKPLPENHNDKVPAVQAAIPAPAQAEVKKTDAPTPAPDLRSPAVATANIPHVPIQTSAGPILAPGLSPNESPQNVGPGNVGPATTKEEVRTSLPLGGLNAQASPEDWNKAILHLNETEQFYRNDAYKAPGYNPHYNLQKQIEPLRQRVNAGEQTVGLMRDILNLKRIVPTIANIKKQGLI